MVNIIYFYIVVSDVKKQNLKYRDSIGDDKHG